MAEFAIKVAPLTDVNKLSTFDCGNDKMNAFLKGPFQESIDNHYCKCFVVTPAGNNNEVMAIYALCFDSVDLDSDDKDDLMSGVASTGVPDVTLDYQDTFLAKRRYPALDITYLAVNKNYRNKGIGRIIVESIFNLARSQNIAGCQFLTVEALKTGEDSAVGFYSKCDFTPNEFPDPNKDTLRMFRTLYPI